MLEAHFLKTMEGIWSSQTDFEGFVKVIFRKGWWTLLNRTEDSVFNHSNYIVGNKHV